MADVTTQKIDYRTTSLPEYLDKPYQEYMGLYSGQVAADLKAGMPQYTGERIAGLGEVQEKAMKEAVAMKPAQQLTAATGLMGAATENALNTNYQPGQYNAQNFGNQVGNYMSPYMQNVVDIQQREAQRQADIASTQRGARAAQAGAFGGSRQGIENAEAARNLAMQKGDIQAQGLQNAFTQASNQYNIGNQLSEQSRQYGAGLGLQGQQAAMQGAGALGTLGNLQYNQAMGINQLQAGYGGMQQDIQQQRLNTQYQDFLNKQNYPYQLLNQYGNVLNRQPANMNMQTTTLGQAPNLAGQIIGTGIGLSGMGKMAEGGMVNSYAEGGVTSQNNVESIIRKLSDQQLQVAMQAAQARQDMATVEAIQQEMAMRASEQRGMASAFNQLSQEAQEETVRMAGGGIIAFADGDVVSDPMGTGAAEIADAPTNPNALSFLQRITNEPAWKAKSAAKEPKPAPKAEPAKSVATDLPVAPKVENKPAPKNVDLSDIPKPSKSNIKSAVQELAEKNDLSKSATDELMDSTDKIFEKLDKRNKPLLDAYNKLMEEQKPDLEKIRQRGIGQAITNFGFTMAANASKGGSFMDSVASASPVLAATMEKTQELQTAAQQNYSKMRMEQMKYEVALQKGDMQTAATLAGQIRQSQQADKLLQFNIAKAKDEMSIARQQLAQSGGRQPETIQNLAAKIMQDPSFKGTPNQALERAALLLKGTGAGITAGAKDKATFISGMKEIDAAYPPIIAKRDPSMASDRSAAIAQLKRLTGVSDDDLGGASSATSSALPSGITVTEVGR